ncbi:MAG: hypothetical protein ACYC6A_17890 [Armatimonadota bacterium]
MRNMILACLLMTSLACLAIPTGLNMMPTADVLKPGQSRLDYETPNSGKLNVPFGASILGTQNGSLFNTEAGIDNITDVGTVYNFKWRFVHNEETGMQAAVGAQNLAEHAQYFLVLTKRFGRVKLSGGAMTGIGDEDDDEIVGMVGASLDLKPFILMVDHVRGDTLERTAGSVGITLSSLTLQGTAYDFDGAGTEYTTTVSYGHRY